MPSSFKIEKLVFLGGLRGRDKAQQNRYGRRIGEGDLREVVFFAIVANL